MESVGKEYFKVERESSFQKYKKLFYGKQKLFPYKGKVVPGTEKSENMEGAFSESQRCVMFVTRILPVTYQPTTLFLLLYVCFPAETQC